MGVCLILIILISMNQLEGELSKLQEIVPKPIDLSFAIGYIAFSISHENIPKFKPAIKEIFGYLNESLITERNFLELLAVLKVKVLRDNLKNLVQTIEHYGTELVCDNNYLFAKFFEKKVVKQVHQGLGIECSICTLQIDTRSLCYLNCNHMYHRKCFNEYSKEQILKKNIPFKCPTQQCGMQIIYEEIQQHLEKDLRERYDQFTFQNYVEEHNADTSWCPTPGCSAVFTFDENLDNYRCVSCKKHYCLRCKCQMHKGITCQEYQSLASLDQPDRKFMILVKGSKFKQCPNCKFWVQKNEGCDHMTCRCKYEFCYVCGGKYGKCKCKNNEVNSQLNSSIELNIFEQREVPDIRLRTSFKNSQDSDEFGDFLSSEAKQQMRVLEIEKPIINRTEIEQKKDYLSLYANRQMSEQKKQARKSNFNQIQNKIKNILFKFKPQSHKMSIKDKDLKGYKQQQIKKIPKIQRKNEKFQSESSEEIEMEKIQKVWINQSQSRHVPSFISKNKQIEKKQQKKQ